MPSDAVSIRFGDLDELKTSSRWQRPRQPALSGRIPPGHSTRRDDGDFVARKTEAQGDAFSYRESLGPFGEGPRKAEIHQEEVFLRPRSGERRALDEGNTDPAKYGFGRNLFGGARGNGLEHWVPLNI